MSYSYMPYEKLFDIPFVGIMLLLSELLIEASLLLGGEVVDKKKTDNVNVSPDSSVQ